MSVPDAQLVFGDQRLLSCVLMRGGTSKAAFFLESDLPANAQERDRMILSAMGYPDARQIDGLGGGTPLTTKVAIVSASTRDDCDVDYLFGQVVPQESRIDYSPTCGNILAAVGPYAIDQDLVWFTGGEAHVRIYMRNTRSRCVATVRLAADGHAASHGEQRISGVPGTAAPVYLSFDDTIGSTCGSLFPTGKRSDVFDGIEVTCIDNGMPVVMLRASDVGVTGYESPVDLDTNAALKAKIEKIRLAAGKAMGLGDVGGKVIPKVTLVAPPREGGALCTRTFIPKHCHDAIGVLGAVSVATALLYADAVTRDVAASLETTDTFDVSVEHPTGDFGVRLFRDAATGELTGAQLVRTARTLFSGHVMVPLLTHAA